MNNILPLDIHTHRLPSEPGSAIVNALIPHFKAEPGHWYSVGIHPWATAEEGQWKKHLSLLSHYLAHPQVVALGEAGYDRLRGGSLEEQKECFEAQASLAEEAGKPLILHVVKAFDELLLSRKRLLPSVPWIVHGFRGKPQQAQQLLDQGFYLSFGQRFNPLSVALTPGNRLLTESDESDADLATLSEKIALLRDEKPESLLLTLGENVQNLFFHS